jgi:hypothetical protein
MHRRFLYKVGARASIVAAVLCAAAVNVGAEGTVRKVSSASDGYCHLKIPALRPSTLASDAPELKSATTGDVIDFYGPCDYDPKNKEEIAAQKRYRSRHYVKF